MSKKRVILSTIAILLVMFAAVSVVSYSIANLGHGDEIVQNQTKNLGADNNTSNYITNIDLIIDAANSKDAESYASFNIVEIKPKSAEQQDSKLGTYVSTDGFADNVLTAFKSTTANSMPKGSVTYNSIVVDTNILLTTPWEYEKIVATGKKTAEEDTFKTEKKIIKGTVQDVLDQADLIYLSSPLYTSYDGDNNLTEDVYNYLHYYASSNKPIIVDFVDSSSTADASKTMSGLVNKIRYNYYKFHTFEWNTSSVSAINFFSSKGSYYLKLNANKKATTGKVLVLANTDTPGEGSMTKMMQDATADKIIENAYYGLDENKPTDLQYTVLNISNGLTLDNLANVESTYDFILLENGIGDVTISADVFNRLRALSESSRHIIFDSRLATATSGSVGATRNNYLKLLQQLVSDKGVEQQTNVLAITYGYMASLNEQGANGKDGAKAIADLINKTIYRDTNTSGKAGKKYRVLEIQPCYPIDLELAKTIKPSNPKDAFTQYNIPGGYYSIPDQVLYGVTKEEIPEGTEYYAFEMSRAKIAHALGIPYEQIEVTSMSTNEFISSKEVAAEAYDLIYIGGDSSAYVPYVNINFSSKKNYKQNLEEAKAAFTAFNMYTHTGIFVDYSLPFGKVGTGSNSIETSGNDLTTIKRDELKRYVDAGLPIIVDKVVTAAFEKTYAFDPGNPDSKNKNRLQQLEYIDIDPDCNMYQFLEYAYNKDQDGAINVGWGTIDSSNSVTSSNNDDTDDDLSNSEVRVENIDKMYGNTLGATVTVYNCATQIKSLVNLSAKRPELSLSDYPMEYQEGANTTNIGTTATFKGKVNASKLSFDSASGETNTSTVAETYTVKLFVDANGDGSYADTEEIESTTYSSSDTSDFELTYSMASDFFGLVNWKVVAYTSDGILCDMKSGCSFFKATKGMQKPVRVLQIMPIDGITATEQPFDGKHPSRSLYFCTECQQSGKEIQYNVTVDGENQNGLDLDSYDDRDTVYIGSQEIYVGKHIHDFGIVKHDTTTYKDDFEDNFAYSLTHGADGTKETGDFVFDLDIVTHTEFDKLCKDALNRTDEQVEVAKAQVEGSETMEGSLARYLAQRAVIEDNSANSVRAKLEAAMIALAKDLALPKASDVKYRDVAIEGILGDNPDKPNGKWLEDQQYYKFWSYINNKTYGSVGGRLDATLVKNAADAYKAYVIEYDLMVDYYNQYRTVVQQTGDEKDWLSNNYDVIVLGLADNFGGADLDAASCEQIRTFIADGGSVVNSHDSLNAKATAASGPDVLTSELMQEFGMDRFHVEDYNKSSKVSIGQKVAGTKEIKFCTKDQLAYNAIKVPVSNRDVVVNVKNEWNAGITWEYVGDEKAAGEDIIVSFTGDYCTQNGGLAYSDESANVGTTTVNYTNGAYESITIAAPVSTKYVGSFVLGKKNVVATLDLKQSGDAIFGSSTQDTDIAADGKIRVDVTVTSEGKSVPNNIEVVCEYRKNVQSAKTVDGVVSFYIDPAQTTTESVYNVPADGSIYRHYPTADSSKYFWTQRLQATDTSLYNGLIASTGNMITYNAPIGITDLWSVYDNSGVGHGPYRYVRSEKESFDHSGMESSGANYQIQYGTRKAQQVNKGGVTMFPFAISEELLISPTHAQTLALDMEDPTVAVWYTLAGTYVNNDKANGLTVDEGFARYNSGYYAASPRDGMNNYFLYSKDGVFYTGAGHMRVTGNLKDNNDERRLFINVIVNCVTKGQAGPNLKLYNKCDKDENCEDNYVNPLKDKENKELSKQIETLFYNKAEGMYQYNIDESKDKLYPEFDFKAKKGSKDIEKIEVFFDLNYNPEDEEDVAKMKTAYLFNEDTDVMIEEYDGSMDSKRGRIRKPDPEPENEADNPLLLKDEYFEPYGDYTYIVVRVQDVKGIWKAARIKINIIPYLFDLTDAGSEAVNSSFDSLLLDMSDRKFNI